MFLYKTSIHLRDTDATGVLFFTEQLRLAVQAFEEYLKSTGSSLAALVDSCDCLMPIVHAEADFTAPLQMGDDIEITIELGRLGNSSFTLNYKFIRLEDQVSAGTASIVHTAVSKKTRSKIPMPKELASVLQKLQQEREECCGPV
ncbi:MAG TPA: thioesterase family protein [Rhabdochlamydiaceae bacterium]|nr:thioesterase family protein [Rhabdochlamydiaceae bacterium]